MSMLKVAVEVRSQIGCVFLIRPEKGRKFDKGALVCLWPRLMFQVDIVISTTRRGIYEAYYWRMRFVQLQ